MQIKITNFGDEPCSKLALRLDANSLLQTPPSETITAIVFYLMHDPVPVWLDSWVVIMSETRHGSCSFSTRSLTDVITQFNLCLFFPPLSSLAVACCVALHYPDFTLTLWCRLFDVAHSLSVVGVAYCPAFGFSRLACYPGLDAWMLYYRHPREKLFPSVTTCAEVKPCQMQKYNRRSLNAEGTEICWGVKDGGFCGWLSNNLFPHCLASWEITINHWGRFHISNRSSPKSL